MTHLVKLMALLSFATLVFSSCLKDDGPDTSYLDERCGIDGRFSPTEPGGPCVRCATEDGYVALGRNKAFCFKPGEKDHIDFAHLFVFKTPPPNLPSDSLILFLSRAFYNPDVGGSRSAYGELGLGVPSQRESAGEPQPGLWGQAGCYYGPERNGLVVSDDPMDISGIWVSPPDGNLPNGSEFRFTIGNRDLNGDCLSELGRARGYVARDTGFVTIHWEDWHTPPGLDTPRIDQAYIVDLPPAWQGE